jgi:hypothetical protein
MSLPAHRIQDDPLCAFESCTLPSANFTHRLHLSLGWSYLQRYGFPEGVVRFRERLRAYVSAVGAEAKYHETLTWAYMILMNEERVLRSPSGESFDGMIARRPDLLDHRNGTITRVYARDELESDEARRVLVLPRRA